MTTYRSVEGDTVDLIAFRHYGDESRAAAVFDANPGLADLGPILPPGTLVRLPEPESLPPPEASAPIRLWS